MTFYTDLTSRDKVETYGSSQASSRADRTDCRRSIWTMTYGVAMGVVVVLGAIFAFQTTSQNNQYNDSAVLGFAQKRSKRQATPILFGAHLVGRRGTHTARAPVPEQNPDRGFYFEWDENNGDLSIVDMAVEVIDRDARGTFLHIERSGYYFVYSQVTYFGRGRSTTGHEVVRKHSSIQSGETILMTYVNTQVPGSRKNGSGNQKRNMDSGYSGGMFLFYSGDEIGVRPIKSSHMPVSHFAMDPSRSFFGLFFLNH